MSDTRGLTELPVALALEVDDVCDDFERFWRRARRRGEALPSPETFAGRISPAARPVLHAALEQLQRELLAESESPVVPGYTVLKEIARGPMGVVYRVRRDADGRELALKTIQSAGLACWSRSLGLQAEGEVLTELRHPHIVPVESQGVCDGLHYLVMPLVEGGDLRQRRDEFLLGAGGSERLRRIAALMHKVADAVAFLHERGILHRDLKPSNILLTRGEPLVCDFGLARRISDGRASLSSAEVVGTRTYMAPEQMEGREALTVEADVWSLGAVLYELLTGRPPFTEGGQLDVERKRTGAEPTSPGDLNPTVGNAELGRICRRCLQRDPAARYRSAAELANHLHRVSCHLHLTTDN
jgi:serine/threonine protein kinase